MDAVSRPQDIDLQTFAEWLESGHTFATPYSVKTQRVYRSVAFGLLSFLHNEEIRTFGEFNTAWARRFIRSAASGAAYSSSYQTVRIAALNVFWCWLIEIGAAQDNPVARLIDDNRRAACGPSGGKRPKRLPDVLGWEEQRRLLAAVQESESRTSVRDYALISMVLASGLRCEELCSLRLADLHLPYRRLRVIGKGNKERIVEFGHAPDVVGAVEMWLLEREHWQRPYFNEAQALFISINGRPMTGSLVYQQVAKYLNLAGLTGRTRHKGAHLLRHTATSIMFARNVPVLQIQENLGHEQLVTTQIYAHLLPPEASRQPGAI